MGLARRKIIRADAGRRRQPRCVACQGVLVSSVLADQPADRAGVLSQDVILSVDDIVVDRPSEVLRVIKGTQLGNEVTLTIFRSGETFVVPVKLGNKPRALDEHENRAVLRRNVYFS